MNLVYQIFYVVNCCGNVTVSETTNPDGPAAFPFFILLIGYLTMVLSFKQCATVTSLLKINYFYHMLKLSSKASHDNNSSSFLFITTYYQRTSIIP